MENMQKNIVGEFSVLADFWTKADFHRCLFIFSYSLPAFTIVYKYFMYQCLQ